MTLISRGQAFLNDRMSVAAGVTVIIYDGLGQPLRFRRDGSLISEGIAGPLGIAIDDFGTISGGITAWVGRTVFAQEPKQPGGASIIFGERDYLVRVEDIDQTPARGWRIVEINNPIDLVTPFGEGFWEVASPETGEPCWRFSDQTRTLYRIHTRRVAG